MTFCPISYASFISQSCLHRSIRRVSSQGPADRFIWGSRYPVASGLSGRRRPLRATAIFGRVVDREPLPWRRGVRPTGADPRPVASCRRYQADGRAALYLAARREILGDGIDGRHRDHAALLDAIPIGSERAQAAASSCKTKVRRPIFRTTSWPELTSS